MLLTAPHPGHPQQLLWSALLFCFFPAETQRDLLFQDMGGNETANRKRRMESRRCERGGSEIMNPKKFIKKQGRRYVDDRREFYGDMADRYRAGWQHLRDDGGSRDPCAPGAPDMSDFRRCWSTGTSPNTSCRRSSGGSSSRSAPSCRSCFWGYT